MRRGKEEIVMDDKFYVYLGFITVCLALEALRRGWVEWQEYLARRRVESYFAGHPDCVVTLSMIQKNVSMRGCYVRSGVCALVREGILSPQISGCAQKVIVLDAQKSFEPDDVSEFSYVLNR